MLLFSPGDLCELGEKQVFECISKGVIIMSAQKYAGFWIRFVAFLIDSLLVCVIIIPLLLSVYGTQYFTWIKPFMETYIEGISTLSVDLLLQAQAIAEQNRVSGDYIFTYILPLGAIVLFWIYRSATPGKIILKTKIVNAQTGGEPSATQCVIRGLGYFVSIFTLFLGFLWIAFDSRKQGFHDKLAGTVVVRD
jgi:uncharacterized RDD family membrane protein YckC